jgi:hypothetical protein
MTRAGREASKQAALSWLEFGGAHQILREFDRYISIVFAAQHNGRGFTRNHIRRSAFRVLARWPRPPIRAWDHGSCHLKVAMNTERFARHHEAREALVLSVAGVTASMLIANLLLLILY